MSLTPAAARASTWCRIIGLLPNSTNGFGRVRVWYYISPALYAAYRDALIEDP